MPFILGGMLAALIAAGGIGIVLAGSGPPKNDPPALPTLPPVTPTASSTPTTTPQPGTSSPTPGTGVSTPAPTAAITPAPSTGGGENGGQGTRYETETFVVTVPAGFEPSGSQTGTSNRLFGSEKGLFFIGSGQLSQPVTPQALIAAEMAGVRKVDPNAKICKGPVELPFPNGPRNAWTVVMCVTLSTQSGQQLPVLWVINSGTASNDLSYFRAGFIAPEATYKEFLSLVVDEIMPTVQFKLLPAEEMAAS